jgi:hypothetical protein
MHTPFTRGARGDDASRRVATTLRVAAAAGALLTSVSCSDSTPPDKTPDKSGTFFGPTVTMANGSARAYVSLDRAGTPTDVGLAFSESALTGLPTGAAEFVLALPSQASATPFKHAVINWVPNGHPPAGVYTVPHFDFHFYTITDAERTAIVSVTDAKMTRLPAAEFIPTGYASGMASVGMGLHWNDPDAPERKGEPFTKTFIYGSYDGAIIFAEPMVAKSYLETKPAVASVSLKLPTQYSARGYQPTTYAVGYDPTTKEHRVAISGLVSR